MRWIDRFAHNHSGPIKFFGGLFVGFLPLVLHYYFYGEVIPPKSLNGLDLIEYNISAFKQSQDFNNLVIRLYIGGLASVALTYLFYYVFERRDKFLIRRYFGDHQYYDFCRDRTRVIKKYSATDLTKPIFATSHSNLFVRPDCSARKFKEQIRSENTQFFEALAKLISPDTEIAKFNLLIYIGTPGSTTETKKWEERAAKEMKERIAILQKFGSAAEPHKFSYHGLIRKFLTDYFVIEDHVFITIRKPENLKAPVTCLHIKNWDAAETYRNWLDSISQSTSKEHGYIDNERLNKIMS